MLAMFERALVAVAAVAVSSYACSAPETEDAPEKAATEQPPPAYTPDPELYPDAGEPSCNAVSVAGLTTGTVEGSTESAPTATGGELTDGTWVFVKAIMFGLSDAIPAAPYLKAKIVLAGGAVQTVAQVDDGESSEEPLSTSETYEASGPSLTIATTCPTDVPVESATFSVVTENDKSTLVVYRTSQVGVVGSFYEKN